MTTPYARRASYRRSFERVGEKVTLRRAMPSPQPAREAEVTARVTGFTPEELASGIDIADRKLIVLAEDVEAAVAAGQWPAPIDGRDVIVKGDKVFVRGRPLTVQAVDDSTRRVRGVLMAYEIVASGS